MSALKIYVADRMAGGMNLPEVQQFLGGGKLILRLATVNSHGDPEIQPTWYFFENDRLYLMTSKDSRKVKNIKEKNHVYFSIDTETGPYRGAKGRGVANFVTDRARQIAIAEKILAKYLGDAAKTEGRVLMDRVRDDSEVVIEITPAYYSVWDYSKRGK